jgi:hypothetical protein
MSVIKLNVMYGIYIACLYFSSAFMDLGRLAYSNYEFCSEIVNFPDTWYFSLDGDCPVARTAHKENRCGHASIPRMGFEPAVPVFERSKTVLSAYVIRLASVQNLSWR